MTEETPGPPAESGQGPTEPRPRSRRRRRGGRGRGGGSRTAGTTGATATKASEKQDKQDQPAPSEAPAEAKADTSADGQAPSGSSSGSRPTVRRRRRRSSGGSSKQAATKTEKKAEAEAVQRGGERVAEAVEPAEPKAKAKPAGDGQVTPGTEAPARRRRRRRRRKPAQSGAAASTAQAAEPAPETEPDGARPPDKPAAAKAAPTRTSRAARRTATDRRRRRPVVHTPRRTDKTMLMTERHDRLQIAVVEGRELVEHYVTRTGAHSMVGNIYLGRVQNVLPGMEAAFVDVGRGRNGVLYAGEVSYDEDVEAGDRRIEQVLKPGQSVIVQVTKDPLRGKGARLTAQVSLPGRYLVYVPDGGASGISRRLPDAERERLRKIIKKIRPSEAGVIVRTAAEGAEEEDLAADLERLKKSWESIKRKSRRARPPKALYEEPELVERVVRDVFSPTEFQGIVTDSREIYERVRSYLEAVAPDLRDRVELHEGQLALFEEFHVAEQIHKALERKVWLPSGGYLIIDRVEAMTVIDVNTGKSVGKTNLEETVVGTNLEAAEEIARQLRLRDIGGIIVIDFIDMLFERNRAEVIRTLQEALARDKTRSQVFDITPLGLLEMTRKKVSEGLLESFSETCPYCEGRGILLTHDV